MTFDVTQALYISISHSWQHWYEVFCVCRHCARSTTFVIAQKNFDDRSKKLFSDPQSVTSFYGALNQQATVKGYVNQRDRARHAPPAHVPEDVEGAFREASTCLAVECWNAAGAMFRLCLDLATRPMLPDADAPDPNRRTRRDLGLRLRWLFDNGKLPDDLRDLSSCVHEDGNDAAHTGTLEKADAEDLLDFARALLDRVYSEPAKLKLAKERREKRRQPQAR